MRAEARDEGRRRLRQAKIDLGWVGPMLDDSAYSLACFPNGLPEGIPADVYNRPAAEQAVELAAEVVQAVVAWFGERGS